MLNERSNDLNSVMWIKMIKIIKPKLSATHYLHKLVFLVKGIPTILFLLQTFYPTNCCHLFKINFCSLLYQNYLDLLRLPFQVITYVIVQLWEQTNVSASLIILTFFQQRLTEKTIKLSLVYWSMNYRIKFVFFKGYLVA